MGLGRGLSYECKNLYAVVVMPPRSVWVNGRDFSAEDVIPTDFFTLLMEMAFE